MDPATGVPMPDLAKALTGLLLYFEANPIPQTPEQLGRYFGWTLQAVEGVLRIGFMTKMNKDYLETPRPSVLYCCRCFIWLTRQEAE